MADFQDFEVAASLKHKVSTTYSVEHRGRDGEQMRDSAGDETTERREQRTPQPTTDDTTKKADESASEKTTAREDGGRDGDGEVQRDGADEVQRDGADEVQRDGDGEVQRDGADEVQRDGADEVQRYRAEEVQTSGSGEVRTSGAEEVRKDRTREWSDGRREIYGDGGRILREEERANGANEQRGGREEHDGGGVQSNQDCRVYVSRGIVPETVSNVSFSSANSAQYHRLHKLSPPTFDNMKEDHTTNLPYIYMGECTESPPDRELSREPGVLRTYGVTTGERMENVPGNKTINEVTGIPHRAPDPPPLPVTQISDEPPDVPLTTSHLLHGRILTSLPFCERPEASCSHGNREDVTRRAQRHAQLIDHFWRRWTHEYLTSLREHQRSSGTNHETIRVGDVVIVHDDFTPRSRWTLAVIE